MAKKQSPLDIMNLMGDAAHKKSQPKLDADGDEDGDMPAPKAKSSKQAAVINEKKKGNAKAPKLPKLA